MRVLFGGGCGGRGVFPMHTREVMKSLYTAMAEYPHHPHETPTVDLETSLMERSEKDQLAGQYRAVVARLTREEEGSLPKPETPACDQNESPGPKDPNSLLSPDYDRPQR